MNKFILMAMLMVVVAATSSAQRWFALPVTPSLPDGFTEYRVPINGVEIWVAVYNEGDGGVPVLFLHGGLGNSNYFGNLIELVSRHRKVVAMDSRGHGRSTSDFETPFSYALMETDVIGVLDHLNVNKVDLVGWSDGAILGLVMSLAHPERLNSHFSYAPNSNPSAFLDTTDSVTFNEYGARTADEYAALSPTPTRFNDFADAIGTMWSTQPDLKAEQLATITVATWIVDGDHEEAIAFDNTAFIAHANPSFALVSLPWTSHFAFLQDEHTFARHLQIFLDIDSNPFEESSAATFVFAPLFFIASLIVILF
jgi:pimeloyl-ACP methyl ester carboxylesterase